MQVIFAKKYNLFIHRDKYTYINLYQSILILFYIDYLD